MSELLYDVCSECGKNINYGESYYSIDKHREVAHRVKGETKITVKKADLLITYCMECARNKDFADIIIARKQKTFAETLDKMLCSKSSPVVRIHLDSPTHTKLGTGIAIGDKGYFLTANHVVRDYIAECAGAYGCIDKKIGSGELKKGDRKKAEKKAEKELKESWDIGVMPLTFGKTGQKHFPAQTNESMCDEESDIALVQVLKPKYNFPALKVNTEYLPTLNEDVYGVTLGDHNVSIFVTRIMAIEKYKRERGIVIGYETDYNHYLGNSGGAILNRYGEAIGIISASKLRDITVGNDQETGLMVNIGRGQFYSFATCSLDIQKYL